MCIEHVFFQHVFFSGPNRKKIQIFFLLSGWNFQGSSVSGRQAQGHLNRVKISNGSKVMAKILGPEIAEAKKQNVAPKPKISNPAITFERQNKNSNETLYDLLSSLAI